MSKGEGGREEREGRGWAGHAGSDGQWGRLGFDPKGGGSPEGLCAQEGDLTQVATAGRTDLGARQGSGGTKTEGTVLVQAGNDGG